MNENSSIEQIEVILRKMNWAQQILDSAREISSEANVVDILAGVSFILDTALTDAERFYSTRL